MGHIIWVPHDLTQRNKTLPYNIKTIIAIPGDPKVSMSVTFQHLPGKLRTQRGYILEGWKKVI